MLFLFAACQPAQPETSVLDTQKQVLGFAAISAISTLEHLQSTPQAIQETRFNAQDVDAYLDLIKTFMGEDNSFSVRVENSTFESYQYTMYITTADITGSREVHEFHYNETITEVEDDETESVIRGVMFVDGVGYQLYGEREVESGEESL